MALRSFLGKGWRFPVDLDQRRGLAMSELEQNIEESIRIIIGTAPGERLMRPEFGCKIHDLIFAPNNSNTHGLVKYYVTESLHQWEPRIQKVTVHVTSDPDYESRVQVNVEYQVIATNNVFNLVYPFYLQRSEGL